MKAKHKSTAIIQTLRKELPHLKESYNVASLSLFGSYIHNTQTQESDLDILVTFSEVPGFLKFIELENYLSDKLEVEVDLVMKDALKKNIGEQIKKEAVSV